MWEGWLNCMLVGISGDRIEISACARQPTFSYPVTTLFPLAAILFISDEDKGNESSGDNFDSMSKLSFWGNKVCAELARLTGLTHLIQIGPFSSSGASSVLHRVKRKTRVTREWLLAKRKGPWEEEKWEGSDVLSVFSFTPSFARKFHRARERERERRLGTSATVTRTSKNAMGRLFKRSLT